jgi:hypothetical protein
MPTTAIDTFFACTLIVAIAVISTVYIVGTMQTQIESTQNLNQESYLRGIADHIVTGYGIPLNWGTTIAIPTNLGLSLYSSDNLYELEIDKITRLNDQNQYALSYIEALTGAKISNIAFGLSLSQMLSIDVTLSSNNTIGDVTEYTFQVAVSQEAGPVKANLHCYALATDFTTDVNNVTSSSGNGSITIEVPNSSTGPALLIVFAQTSLDERLCAYTVYSFAHLSDSSEPNGTFLNLSPLNNTLNLQFNYTGEAIEKAYAFSYDYSTNLTSTSNTTFSIPDFVDNSPIIIAVQGLNNTVNFIEWVSYPQIPLTFGGSFSNSSAHVFVYTVTIDKVLYRLTLRFGDVVN